MKKYIMVIVVLFMFTCVTVWATTFLFVIQPIGAVPDGVTMLLFKPDRLFTETTVPFVCSADGVLLDTIGEVNLLGRDMAMGAIVNSAKGKIVRLPYSHTLYLISTGGVEFSK